MEDNQGFNNTKDKGGLLWGLLGFLIPIVGLILWLIWRKEKPRTAKALIMGAVIGFVTGQIGSLMLHIFIGSLGILS